MTPEERTYAAMWLSELWPVVKEYHPPVDPRPVENAGDERPRKQARAA